MGRKAWYFWCLFVLACGLVCAEDAQLRTSLQRLPIMVGEEKRAVWPRKGSWVDLGLREHIGHNALQRANPGRFAPGRELLIPGRHAAEGLVPVGLVLNLPELTLFHWQGGTVAAWYPVSIGMTTSRWHTPIGELYVATRIRNPAWRRPDWAGGGVVRSGPRNPLGDRWIGLSREGIGIHGTNQPTSIGRTVSHGCIRMFPAHVRELFEHTWLRMPIFLTYETVTVGQQGGVVYLSVYPDVYGRGTNRAANAQKRLAAFGLASVLSPQELTQHLQRADGIARPILGSAITVTVNGAPAVFGVGPTFRRDRTYLPVRELAEAAGADVRWDAENNTVTLTRGGNTLILPLGKDDCFLALDALFAPVRTIVEGLGGTVEFASPTLRIRFPA